MKKRTFSQTQLEIATLAGRLLPVVQSNPELAYASAISRRSGLPDAQFWLSQENMVGAALRYLESKGLLKSERIPNPRSDVHGKVKLYSLTPDGAFHLASTSANAI